MRKMQQAQQSGTLFILKKTFIRIGFPSFLEVFAHIKFEALQYINMPFFKWSQKNPNIGDQNKQCIISKVIYQHLNVHGIKTN